MRLLTYSLYSFLALVSVVAAVDPDPTKLPSCALNCQLSAFTIGATTCLPTDVACLCSDKIFMGTVTKCVLGTCTVKEALITQRLSSRQCGVPVRPRDGHTTVIRAVFIAITTVFIVIRLIVKSSHYGGKWWWDDYFIFLAYLLVIGLCVTTVYEQRYGLGTDLWDLSFDEITKFFISFYITAPVYKIQIGTAKVSVCFFFLRFFPSRRFRRYATFVIALNIIVFVSFVFVDLFQCRPLKAAWIGWAREEKATCLNIPKVALANGVINVVLDIMMLALPIYEVSQLQLQLGKKLSVAGMFAMGFLLTITSILRIESFVRFLNTTNPTGEYASLHYWSLIECNISVICACLPDARVFFLRNIPAAFGCASPRNASVSEAKEWSPYPSTMSPTRDTKGTISVKRTVSVDYEATAPRSKGSYYRRGVESANTTLTGGDGPNFLFSATKGLSPLNTIDFEDMKEEAARSPTIVNVSPPFSPRREHADFKVSRFTERTTCRDPDFEHVWPLPNEPSAALSFHDTFRPDTPNTDTVIERVARRVNILPARQSTVDILPPRQQPAGYESTQYLGTESDVRHTPNRTPPPPPPDVEDRPPRELEDGYLKWEIRR